MNRIGRTFSLASEPGRGVFCGKSGVFVASVPLLERDGCSRGNDEWGVRPVLDLNRDLSRCYGVAIQFNGKVNGLSAICEALNRNDLLHAQITTLHLQIPDPPALPKSNESPEALVHLVQRLRMSGLLKADWDPTKHPRWPAGSPHSIGGQFAAGSSANESTVGEQNQSVIPAEIAIPMPGTIPLPLEIPPLPLVPPGVSPRDVPRNPYPDRPECEEEWASAFEYCGKLMLQGRLGSDGYRGMGNSFYRCVMGQVSRDCGGNPTSLEL
jgi:hypothetical protein